MTFKDNDPLLEAYKAFERDCAHCNPEIVFEALRDFTVAFRDKITPACPPRLADEVEVTLNGLLDEIKYAFDQEIDDYHDPDTIAANRADLYVAEQRGPVE